MNDTPNPIESEVDFNSPGIHCGYLRLPWSSHRSAYGWIPIPVASVKNGSGPTVLVMAGNHGDEYEGQVVLSEFVRQVNMENVSGQIILLTNANAPAAQAGMRVSPIDDGNLNRMFPGDPVGSPTQVIAHYIESVLLARADYLLDMHSGGSSLQYLSCAISMHTDVEHLDRQQDGILARLGVEHVLRIPRNSKGVLSSAAALRQDTAALVVETGGNGQLSQRSLGVARAVLYRFLNASEVYSHLPAELLEPYETMYFSGISYCYARNSGLFEPLVELGSSATVGQLAALIHRPDEPNREPEQVVFESNGIVVCRRAMAKVERGDCLYELGG